MRVSVYRWYVAAAALISKAKPLQKGANTEHSFRARFALAQAGGGGTGGQDASTKARHYSLSRTPVVVGVYVCLCLNKVAGRKPMPGVAIMINQDDRGRYLQSCKLKCSSALQPDCIHSDDERRQWKTDAIVILLYLLLLLLKLKKRKKNDVRKVSVCASWKLGEESTRNMGTLYERRSIEKPEHV